MFDWIRKLFGFGKKEEEETVVNENIMELKSLEPAETETTEAPATRYTEEYAEFNERELAKRAEEADGETGLKREMPENTSADNAPEEAPPTAEEMLEDPFADVAAQDADVEVPPAEEAGPEDKPEEAPPTAEEMLADPFADVAAQDEDPE